MSTFTANLNLEQVARGGDVGTWDTPTNSNWSITDLVVGGTVTISASAGNVVLSAAQFQASTLLFTGTVPSAITITFPTSFTKAYKVLSTAVSTGPTITLATTATSGQVICAEPGGGVECINDGANLKYFNMGRIGEYWDFAGSSVPSWVQGCTVPPYLPCTGGSLSSATYPILFGQIFGTLPDARGRMRMALDAGVGRVSSAVSNVPGNTLLGSGGDQSLQAHSHTISDPGHTHGNNAMKNNADATLQTGAFALPQSEAATISAALTGITGTNGTGAGGAQNMPPLYVGGITMIRAA